MDAPNTAPDALAQHPDGWIWPFYEQLALARRLPVLGRAALAAAVGAAYLLFMTRPGHNPLHHPTSWLLALILSAALGLLQIATVRLRAMLTQLLLHQTKLLEQRGPHPAPPQHAFLDYACAALTSPRMAAWGVLFGVLNVGFGLVFGIPQDLPDPNALAAGFFFAGFFCGMAAHGIFVVVETVRRFAAQPLPLFDSSHPDRCGGMAFVGSAVSLFAAVTLIMGVLIALYIALSPWEHKAWVPVQAGMFAWAVFPFLMSAFVLFAPMSELHRKAVRFKEDRDHALKQKLGVLRAQLDESSAQDLDATDALLARISDVQAQRQSVHAMRTWPYSLQAQAGYALALLPAVAAAVASFDQIRRAVSGE